MSWHCMDDYTEHLDWDWTCDRTNDVTPTCGKAFYIRDIEVSGSHPGYVIAALVALVLGAIAYAQRDRLSQMMPNSDAKAKELEMPASEDLEDDYFDGNDEDD
eukprot:7115851-Prymnesium_polylepis.1